VNHVLSAYTPKGLWCGYDFKINAQFWQSKGFETCRQIRIDNIKSISEAFRKLDIEYIVFGKTLRGIFLQNELEDDHDDDMALLEKYRSKVVPQGFRIIRNTKGMLSVERGYRYVDICFLAPRATGKLGYDQKSFPAEYFKDLRELSWKGDRVSVPERADELLNYLYPKVERVLPRAAGRARRTLGRVARLRDLNKLRQYLLEREKVPLAALRLVGIGKRVLSEQDFLKIKVEPDDSFNWQWRISHLGPVTDEGRCRTVAEIVDYLRDDAVRLRIERDYRDTDMSQPFLEPLNINTDFWWGGNNYFWNCVKYGFRGGVVPYSLANDYIETVGNPHLYSSAYYEALPALSDLEVENLMRKNPIEIQYDAVIGGKHRVFAMIGRLIRNEGYIPVSAIILP
jgi:hypothetical protein